MVRRAEESGRINLWFYFRGDVMVKSIRRHKWKLICLAAAVVAVVALFNPEYAENVTRAFMLILAGV